MTLDDITILVPTKGRRDLAANLVRSIKHRPFVFIANEETYEQDLPLQLRAYLEFDYWTFKGLTSGVRAVELGIEQCQTRLVCTLCDDVEPEPGFLEEALKVYNATFGDEDAVVSINNGIAADADIACFALMSREFYLKLVAPAPYERYYQDTEWTAKARLLGRYAYAENARVTHRPFEPQNLEAKQRDGERYDKRMREFYGVTVTN